MVEGRTGLKGVDERANKFRWSFFVEGDVSIQVSSD